MVITAGNNIEAAATLFITLERAATRSIITMISLTWSPLPNLQRMRAILSETPVLSRADEIIKIANTVITAWLLNPSRTSSTVRIFVAASEIRISIPTMSIRTLPERNRKNAIPRIASTIPISRVMLFQKIHNKCDNFF